MMAIDEEHRPGIGVAVEQSDSCGEQGDFRRPLRRKVARLARRLAVAMLRQF